MRRRITDDEKQRILALKGKRTMQEIATMFGVSRPAVANIMNGRPEERRARHLAAGPLTPRMMPAAEEVDASLGSSSDPLPDVPDDVPSDVDLALVDRWIRLVEDAAGKANDAGNMTAFASLTAKLVALLEHRRKVVPIPQSDPNEHPDMIAMAEGVWARLERAFQ